MAETNEPIEVFYGSGNVFADLGLPDAEELQLKADLCIEILQSIANKKLSRSQAMRKTGWSKEEFARLHTGPSADFTFEQLFHCLNRLGRTVEVRLSPEETEPEKARTLLVA